MKNQKQISRRPGSRRSGDGRASRSSLCSCTEARIRRNQAPTRKAEQPNQPPGFNIPEPLRMDQNELCQSLERATLSGGKTGKAATVLLKVLQPHLLKEEEDMLQTLGFLLPLSQGQITPAMLECSSPDGAFESANV